jgi:signal peptidase I
MNNDTNKEPWLAVIYSSFFAGIGQIYSKKIVLGIALIIIEFFLLMFSILLLAKAELIGFLFLLLLAVVYISNLFNAHSVARKNNSEAFEKDRKATKDPWLAVFLTRIFPGIGNIYLNKIPIGILIIILIFANHILLSDNYPILSTIIYIIISILAIYIAYISAPIKREKTHKKIYFVSLMAVVVLFIAFSFAMIIRQYVLQAYFIPSGSMEDTLFIGDHIFVEKLSYNKYLSSNQCDRSKCINRGDIVVYNPPSETRVFLHRCIAIEGDEIHIENNVLYINGKEVSNTPFGKGFTNYDGFGEKRIEGKVPKDTIVVLGDNRENSSDSRAFGYLPIDRVIAKCNLIYWNTNMLKKFDFSRFGKVN